MVTQQELDTLDVLFYHAPIKDIQFAIETSLESSKHIRGYQPEKEAKRIKLLTTYLNYRKTLELMEL